MADKKSRAELINLLLGDKYDSKLEEEEIMHLLVQQKVSKNINSLQNENLSFGARMADNIAKFAGSWTFIITFIACLILWIIINSLLVAKPFDAYPFILLNLILSCVAAIQAPVIMMSQNRQEEKDRLRSLNDYKTNLKTEIIIEDLHQKLDEMIDNQEKLLQKIDRMEKHINLQK
ncbi:MAG TPA: DUF1003 domain-containing protein [Caproiciproducens sp.]|nr:DUF1003 domain-containing protein [Caproiciproducens sp.]